MANEVVSCAAETSFRSLELSKGELLIQNNGCDAVAERAEGVQSRSNHRSLPGGELGGQSGICGFSGRRNLETGGVNGMEQCMEFRRHRMHIHLVHAAKRQYRFVERQDFVEGQIAVTHGLTERKRDRWNFFPE